LVRATATTDARDVALIVGISASSRGWNGRPWSSSCG